MTITTCGSSFVDAVVSTKGMIALSGGICILFRLWQLNLNSVGIFRRFLSVWPYKAMQFLVWLIGCSILIFIPFTWHLWCELWPLVVDKSFVLWIKIENKSVIYATESMFRFKSISNLCTYTRFKLVSWKVDTHKCFRFRIFFLQYSLWSCVGLKNLHEKNAWKTFDSHPKPYSNHQYLK